MTTKKTKEQYDAVTLTSEKPQRMVFCNLAEPKAPPLKHGKAKPQYSATFLLDPIDPVYSGEGKSIVRIALAVAKEEFPQLYADAIKNAKANSRANLTGVLSELVALGVNVPFLSGGTANEDRVREGKSPYEWAPGKILFKASSGEDYQPKLGSTESGKGVLFDRDDLKMHASKFYAGADAFFKVQFAGFLVDGKRYVKAYLQQVFVTGTGERLGNAGAETFDKYLGHVSNTNPVDADPIAGL